VWIATQPDSQEKYKSEEENEWDYVTHLIILKNQARSTKVHETSTKKVSGSSNFMRFRGS
jgi:hypothetical protein